MPRRARIAPDDLVYHTLNRANGRNELFSKLEDYVAFEQIMVAAMHRFPIRLLAYLMTNHWHMLRHTTGYGHIYQGRFKSFPIEQDQSLLNVLRYVERNALRANLVDQALEWRWCSLWRKLNGDRESLLSAWPLDRPEN